MADWKIENGRVLFRKKKDDDVVSTTSKSTNNTSQNDYGQLFKFSDDGRVLLKGKPNTSAVGQKSNGTYGLMNTQSQEEDEKEVRKKALQKIMQNMSASERQYLDDTAMNMRMAGASEDEIYKKVYGYDDKILKDIREEEKLATKNYKEQNRKKTYEEMYGDISANEDFEENKDYRSTKHGDGTRDALTGYMFDNGYDDIEHDIINKDGLARLNYNVNKGDNYLTNENTHLDYLDQTEIDKYNYLYNTKGRDTAREYLDSIKSELYKRQSEGESAYWKEQSNQKFKAAPFMKNVDYYDENTDILGNAIVDVAPSVLSVIGTLGKPLERLGQLGDVFLNGGEIDQFNPKNSRLSTMSNSIRETVGEKWDKAFKDVIQKGYAGAYANELRANGYSEEEIQQMLSNIDSNFGSGAGNFTYQTLMSMADFLTTALVTGGFGNGAADELTQKIGENLSLAIMGSGAAADATLDAKAKGIDDEKAFVIGSISGMAEIVTEKVSIETLLDKTLKNTDSVKYILKNFLAEGSEEVGSDLINLFADVIINGDENEIRTRVNELMTEGKTESEAFGIAIGEQLQTMGLDFLGGAVSGGLMGGGSVVASNYMSGLGINDIDTARQIATELIENPSGARSEKLAQTILEKVNNGQTPSTSEMGMLMNQLTMDLDIKEQEDAKAELSNLEKMAVDKVEYDNRLAQAKEKAEMTNTMPNENKSNTEQNTKPQIEENTDEINKEAMTFDYLTRDMGESAKSVMQNMYSGGDMISYVQKMTEGYLAGAKNIPLNELSFNDGTINSVQLQAIYNAGQMDRMKGDAIYNATIKGELPILQSIKRNDGTNVEIRLSEVEKGTGRQTAMPKDRETASIKGGKYVSTKELGITNGVEDKGVRIISEDQYTKTMESAVKSAKETIPGANIVMVSGLMALNDKSYARGIIETDVDGNVTIYVQADHPEFTSEQLIKHEVCHNLINNGEISVMDTLAKLQKKLGEKKFKEYVRKYGEAYSMVTDGKEMTDEQINRILTEIICDAYGNMNAFEQISYGSATVFAPFVESVKESTERNTNQANAPPTDNSGMMEWEEVDFDDMPFNFSKEMKTQFSKEIRKGAREFFDGKQLYTDSKLSKARNELEYSREMNNPMMEKAMAVFNDKKSKIKYAKDMKSLLKDVADLRKEIVTEFAKEEYDNNLPKDIPGPTIKGNASYSKSIENALVCVRSLVNQYYFDRVSELVGRPLTIAEQLYAQTQLNNASGRNEQECQYCYIAMDRAYYRQMLKKYYDDYNAFYDLVQKDKESYRKSLEWEFDESLTTKKERKNAAKKNPLYNKYLNKRDSTINMWNRYQRYVKDALEDNRVLKPEDLATDKRMEDAKLRDELTRWYMEDAYHYSESAAQAVAKAREVTIDGKTYNLDYVAYNGSILKLSPDAVEQLNSEYGLRMYSYSDYVPHFILENIQMVTDASVMGLKMLSYTKDVNFARIFAETNMNINISVKGFSDGNGGFIQDEMQGANWEEAKNVRNDFDNVGIVYVATSDAEVKWAIAQDWVDVVIPWHTVRYSGAEYTDAFGYENFKQTQADKKQKSWKSANETYKAENDGKELHKSIPPTKHKNDITLYENELKKNHLNPRFEKYYKEFKDKYDGAGKNMYMKLVNETRKSYEDTQPVVPRFNHDLVVSEMEKVKTFEYGVSKEFKTEANRDAVTSDSIETTAEDIANGNINYSKDITKLTREDARELLEKASQGQFDTKTYIPIRVNTPAIVIWASKKIPGLNLKNLPMLMEVGKVIQATEVEDDSDVSNKAHGLDVDTIMSIVESLDSPKEIYYQKDNKKITELLKIRFKDGRKGFAVISFNANKKESLLNGYAGNEFNILVTTYAYNSKDLAQYTNSENNVLLYKKGQSQSELGSLVPSYLNESPYYEDKVTLSDDDVKPTSNTSKEIDIDKEFETDEDLFNMLLKELGINESENESPIFHEKPSLKKERKVDEVNKILKKIGMSFDGTKKLAWTNERIDKYLKNYAASNKDYAQAYVTYMSPIDYLKLTAGTKVHTIEDIQNSNNKYGDLDLTKIDNDYDWAIRLTVDESGRTTEVIGHEGRHRMMMLGNAGFEQVPVLIFNPDNKYSKSIMNNWKLKPQKFYDDVPSKSRMVTISEAIPLNQNNKDLVLDKFGENVNADAYYSKEPQGMKELREENNALKSELNNLANEIDKWKGELRISKPLRVREVDADKIARQLIKDYSSTAKRTDISGKLEIIGDYVLNNNADNDYADNIKAMAYDIASDLVDTASVLVDDGFGDIYQNLKKYYKDGSGFSISEKDKASIPDWNDFRKRNFGKIKIANNGLNVDVAYMELSDMYPDLFPSEITHPADQLMKMVEVIDDIAPRYENPYKNYAFDMASIIDTVANDVIEKSAMGQMRATKSTFADRQEQRVQRAEKKTMDVMAKYNQKIEDLKEKRNKDISNLKESYKKANEKRVLNKKTSELRNRIIRHCNDLSQKLRHPTDKQHIPQAYKSAVARVLASINLESNYRTINGKRVNVADIPFEESGETTKRTEAFARLRKEYENLVETGSVPFDESLLGTDGWLQEVIDMGDTPIGNLDINQLEVIMNVLAAVEGSIKTANKMFNKGKFQFINDYANALYDDNISKKQKSEWRFDFLNKLPLDMLTPEAFFYRLGNTGQELYRMMRDSQDDFIRIIKDATDFNNENFKGMDSNKLENTKVEVRLGKQDIEMTTAQLMELYVLAQRPQALEHILTGGVFFNEVNSKKLKVERMIKPINHITQEELYSAFAKLTPEQIMWADTMQRYLSNDMSELGNKASMEVYNYKKFNEEKYWRIRVYNLSLKQEVGADTKGVTSVANKGMTKATKPNPNNALLVGSIFNSYTKHIFEMAEYSAWLKTMEDINRIRNFRLADENNEEIGRVGQAIQNVHGIKGTDYLQKLLTDLANGVHSEQAYFGGMFGNYKAAAVGLNLRVTLQQPTAILRAMDMISPKYLTAGLLNPMKGWAKAVKYSPIAQWKDWGYFDINTGKQMKDVLLENTSKMAKAKETIMKPASVADSFAWGQLWNAIELETKDKYPDIHPNSNEFHEICAERFARIIDHSQVVDGVLQRSQIMRSESFYSKMITAFMGEPTKQYNQFMNAIYDIKNGDTTKARKQFVRVFFAMSAAGIVNAMVQSIVDAMRHSDKDKDYWEQWLEEFTGITGDEESFGDYVKSLSSGNVEDVYNPTSYLPLVKDIASIVKGYNVDRMDVSMISDVVSATQKFIKVVKGEGKETLGSAILSISTEFGKLFGLPAANVKKDILAIANTIINGTGNLELQYNRDKLLYDVKAEKNGSKVNYSRYVDILHDAYVNDKTAYKNIYNDLMKNGYDKEKITSTMNSKLVKDAGVKSVKELPERYVTPDVEDRYKATLKTITNSTAYRRLNAEQQQTARSDVYSYVVNPSDTLKSTLQKANKNGITDTQYLLYTLARKAVDKPNKNGKTGTYTEDEKKQAASLVGIAYSKIKAMESNK